MACAAPLFLGVALTAALGMAAGTIALAGLPLGHTASLVAVLVIVVGAFAPSLSFRMSGLRLPALPRNAEELQENIEPFPAADVMARSAVADGYLTAFHVVVGAACAGCLTLIAGQDGWAAAALTAALSALLALHARTVGSVPQRLALLLPAVYGLALLTGGFAAGLAPGERPMLLTALVAVAGVAAVVSWTVPGRRLLPYWGRIADLLHSLAALSLLPLALTVAGVFQLARAAGG